MLTRPKLVALDLDGTLLDASSQLPEAHLETVAWLKSEGIAPAIVTGRPLLTTKWVWERLELETPVVCFNGVWVGVPGEAPFAMMALEEEEVREVIAGMAPLRGSICVYPGAERWIIHQFTPRTQHFERLYGVTIEENAEVLKDWEGPSCKVMFVTEPDLLADQIAQFKEKIGDKYHVVQSQEDRFEVHRHGVHKAWGLEKLAGCMGIEQSEVWACGDARNDLEMIQWAATGCAMGQAPQALKDAADLVLPAIDDGGLLGLKDLIPPR